MSLVLLTSGAGAAFFPHHTVLRLQKMVAKHHKSSEKKHRVGEKGI